MPAPVPVKKSAYVYALLAAVPQMEPEVHRAVPVAMALALTARSDGSRACLSGPQLSLLLSTGRSTRTVDRHLAVLREAGWIVQTERGGWRGRKPKASIYGLTQPATDGRLGHGSQPATDQAPTCHPDGILPSLRDLGPHSGAGSPEVAHHPARPDDAFLDAEVLRLKTGECGPITDSLLDRWRKWAADLGVEPDHVAELLADVVVVEQPVPARLPPPPGLFPDPPQRVDVA